MVINSINTYTMSEAQTFWVSVKRLLVFRPPYFPCFTVLIWRVGGHSIMRCFRTMVVSTLILNELFFNKS